MRWLYELKMKIRGFQTWQNFFFMNCPRKVKLYTENEITFFFFFFVGFNINDIFYFIDVQETIQYTIYFQIFLANCVTRI